MTILIPPTLPLGEVEDKYDPGPGWDTCDRLFLRANDNEGSRIRTLAVRPLGTTVRVTNTATPVDCGVLALLHGGDGSPGFLPFDCPNDRDFCAPKGDTFDITVTQDSNGRVRWSPSGGARSLHLTTHSLGIYPHLVMPMMSGVVDAWDPVAIAAMGAAPYASGLGAGGVSLLGKDGSCWYVQSATAEPVHLRGMKWISHNSPDAAGQGPLRWLVNIGPAPWVIEHSTAQNPFDGFACPNGLPYTLAPDDVVQVLSRQMGRWAIVSGGVQPIQRLDLLTAQNIARVPPNATVALPGGVVTHDFNPTGVALDANGNGYPSKGVTRVVVTGTGPAIIDGFVGPGAGCDLMPEHTLLLFGAVTFRCNTASAIGNHLYTPNGLDYAKSGVSRVELIYDHPNGAWFVS